LRLRPSPASPGGQGIAYESVLAFSLVMPAKAGIQGKRRGLRPWIPAFAGMTESGMVAEMAKCDCSALTAGEDSERRQANPRFRSFEADKDSQCT
jgi:hypothetical protein